MFTTLKQYFFVILTLLGCIVLSANAIRCHQCNSHLEEDCRRLQLTVPRASADTEYLKECTTDSGDIGAFCRKTSITIQSTGENRIVRSCGWIPEGKTSHNRTDRCFTADNEGFLQQICTCFSDGCNSAPFSMTPLKISTLGLSLMFLFIAIHLRY